MQEKISQNIQLQNFMWCIWLEMYKKYNEIGVDIHVQCDWYPFVDTYMRQGIKMLDMHVLPHIHQINCYVAPKGPSRIINSFTRMLKAYKLRTNPATLRLSAIFQYVMILVFECIYGYCMCTLIAEYWE